MECLNIKCYNYIEYYTLLHLNSIQDKDMVVKNHAKFMIFNSEILISSNPAAQTLDQAIENAQIDESRIIQPSMGLSSEALYQYVPATKLKGLEEWVPESLHYTFHANSNYIHTILNINNK